MIRIRSIVYVFFFALTLFVFLPNSNGNRVGHEGDDWLKMSADSRQAYATGYFFGYTHGVTNGCLAGTKDIRSSLPGPQNDPLQKCLDQGQQFVDLTVTAKMVTDFYNRYPNDRYLYIRDVMGALFRGMTLEEIHMHASPGGVTSSN